MNNYKEKWLARPAVTVLILLLGAACTGCKKFLDKKMNTAINTPTSIADLQALLDDADIIMNSRGTPTFTEASADDYMLLPGAYEQLSTRPRMQAVYKWKPYEYSYPNEWADAYSAIYNANYCLEMLEKIMQTAANSAQWQNVKGSALFFRAYYFLHLAWTFAKAYEEGNAEADRGIVLRLGADFNVPSTRATVKASYDQILTDVKNAITFLPDLPPHPFRPSKAAAYGLLARAYLSMRQYDSAFRYADQCLGLKNGLMDLNGDADIGQLTVNYPFKQFNKETIFYTVMGTSGTSTLQSTSRICIDTALYRSYKENDLRKIAFFRLSEGLPIYKGSYSQSSRLFSGMATDEMYLIRAECFLKKKVVEKEKALADLNKLLSHRYAKNSFTPVNVSSTEEAIAMVLAERRKELVFRGIRWIDIKRLNKEGANIVPRRQTAEGLFELPVNSNYYALPIPDDIVHIAGIPQNEY